MPMQSCQYDASATTLEEWTRQHHSTALVPQVVMAQRESHRYMRNSVRPECCHQSNGSPSSLLGSW